MSDRLKLRCEDADDLVVLSSVLQDAAMPLAELAWLPQERRFVIVASRFAWDKCVDVTLPPEQANIECYWRSNFGVTFEGVSGVKSRGIDLDDRSRILSLLAIRAAEAENGAALDLVFAGDTEDDEPTEIRLEVDRILVHGQDIGDPWPTQLRPHHPGVEAA